MISVNIPPVMNLYNRILWIICCPNDICSCLREVNYSVDSTVKTAEYPMIDTSFDMFIETIVPHNELIVSRSDLSGIITYVNETFAEISGYIPEELIGRPHSIVRHPDMPKSLFAELWHHLKKNESWSGYIKNLRKDKGYYWVHAHISVVYKDGEPVEYKSVFEPIDRETRIRMQRKYDHLRETEENHCRVVIYTSCDKAKELGEKL